MLKDILARNDAAEAGQKEMAALRQYFPQCFKADGTFDLEAFKASLPGGMTLTDETSGFNWLGKNYARMLTNMDTTTLLVPDEAHNSEPENRHSHNVYISGNNLDALQHLVKSYGGRIKVIYIDPPYNTGSDGFVYNDKFNFTAEDLARRLDISMEEANHILSMTRRGSASHAAWLTFMLPRLTFARDLLADDGVIFISIDDNEQANLKELCDEIFGEECFIGDFLWKKRQQVDSRTQNGASRDQDYLLCYGKNDSGRIRGKLSDKSKYSNPDNDPRGDWMSDNMVGLASESQRPNLHYDLTNPKTGITYKCPPTGWRYEKSRMEQLMENNEVLFPKSPNGRPRRKKFLKDVQSEYTGFSTFFDTVYSSQGTRELTDLFDGKDLFDFPKPVDYIRQIIEQGVAPTESNDIYCLDFFGGSSTTAQAVMELNSNNANSNVHFIIVQIQEPYSENSEAFKSGYKTIDEVGMERIRRAAKKIKADNPLFAGDLGFKHYTLEEPKEDVLQEVIDFDPQQAVTDLTIDDFGRGAVLRTFMEADGYGLTDEPEEVMLGRYKAYYIGDHLYLLNPDNDFDADSLVALMDKYNGEMFSPHNIVVFGYSFGFVNREALQKNLRTLREGNKTLNVNLDIRY
jgi:type III restriction enzyme/adenine-specific DNA-methyltransferase